MNIYGFKNVLVAFFLSEFGRAMYFVSITWFLFEVTNDSFYTGVLIGLGFLPGLVLNLFFGVIVDRYNKKILCVLANMLCSISMVALLIINELKGIGPWVIIVVHMLLQMSGSLFRPAIQAFIAEQFEKGQLTKIYSQSSSLAILGGLIGASFGGLIIHFVNFSGAMLMVAGSFIIASASLYLIKSERKYIRKIQVRNSIVKDMLDGYIYIKNHKFLLSLFVVMLNGQLIFHSSLGFLAVYTADFLHQSATIYGLLDATLSCGGVIAGILGAWWWKKARNKIAFNSLIIIFAGLLIVGITSVLSGAFLGVFLIGIGTTWLRVLLQSVQQIATDYEYHGRMASYRMLGNQGTVAITAPILGWIAANYGVNYIYISLLIPTSICIIFAYIQANQKQFKEITLNS